MGSPESMHTQARGRQDEKVAAKSESSPEEVERQDIIDGLVVGVGNFLRAHTEDSLYKTHLLRVFDNTIAGLDTSPHPIDAGTKEFVVADSEFNRAMKYFNSMCQLAGIKKEDPDRIQILKEVVNALDPAQKRY